MKGKKIKMEDIKDPKNTSMHRKDGSQFWSELSEANPDAILFDGPGEDDFFDSCIVGYAWRINMDPVVVYDEEKMIEAMMFKGGLSYEDAVEYLSFNTFGSWFGDGTPLILRSSKNIV